MCSLCAFIAYIIWAAVSAPYPVVQLSVSVEIIQTNIFFAIFSWSLFRLYVSCMYLLLSTVRQ